MEKMEGESVAEDGPSNPLEWYEKYESEASDLYYRIWYFIDRYSMSFEESLATYTAMGIKNQLLSEEIR